MSKYKKISVLLLAAGKGSRLQPYTNVWPKCLMPVQGKPVLQHWLEAIKGIEPEKVLVNLHHHAEKVQEFLNRPSFNSWVNPVIESELLGTAGTFRANKEQYRNSTVLLVHADNFCQCDLRSFIRYHQNERPKDTALTMMTFDTSFPENCGIVETNYQGVVTAFYEKIINPPGNRANGAVYLLEPEILEWIIENPDLTDFSTQVLPKFIGRIATWHNSFIHIDIGNIQALKLAQNLLTQDFQLDSLRYQADDDIWASKFAKHPIHQLISEYNLMIF